MLNYGLDVHKKYTTYCIMDDDGRVLREGRCQNEDLPKVFSLKGRKRAVLEAGQNWSYFYDLIEPLVDQALLAHPLRVRAIAAARRRTPSTPARSPTCCVRTSSRRRMCRRRRSSIAGSCCVIGWIW